MYQFSGREIARGRKQASVFERKIISTVAEPTMFRPEISQSCSIIMEELSSSVHCTRPTVRLHSCDQVNIFTRSLDFFIKSAYTSYSIFPTDESTSNKILHRVMIQIPRACDPISFFVHIFAQSNSNSTVGVHKFNLSTQEII